MQQLRMERIGNTSQFAWHARMHAPSEDALICKDAIWEMSDLCVRSLSPGGGDWNLMADLLQLESEENPSQTPAGLTFESQPGFLRRFFL